MGCQGYERGARRWEEEERRRREEKLRLREEKYRLREEIWKNIEQVQKIDKSSKTKIKTFKAEVIDDPNDTNKVFVNVLLEPEKKRNKKTISFICND